MKRAFLIAALTLAALAIVGPAYADVASTMQTAGTNIVTWVRAGAILVVIFCGLSLIRGWMGAIAFVPALAGLAIAINPEVIVGWVG